MTKRNQLYFDVYRIWGRLSVHGLGSISDLLFDPVYNKLTSALYNEFEQEVLSCFNTKKLYIIMGLDRNSHDNN